MDLFKRVSTQHRREFMSHVSPECLGLLKRSDPITLQEWNDLSANSYERRLMFPRLSDEALIAEIAYYVENSSYRALGRYEAGSTYEEVLIGVLLPELLKRFKNKEHTDEGR